MSDTKLKAGFGRGWIAFPEEMFPVEGFQKVHDLPGARVMVLESGDVRVAVAALEMVNVPEKAIHICKKVIEEKTETAKNHIWVHVTHTISTMHEPGPMGPPDKRPPEKPEDIRKKELYYAAIESAITEAAEQAAEDFSEAYFGWGTGECDTNINRDMETPFGWWLGLNPEGPSNKQMTVLKVERPDGTPKGFFISYGIKPCAIDNAGMHDGTRQVSADVCGVCSNMMEKKYKVPALFAVSAAADQVPKEVAWIETVNESGEVFFKDDGVEKGLQLVEKYGTQMGECAIAIAEGISCEENQAEIKYGKASFQWAIRDSRRRRKPSWPGELPDDGTCSVEAELFTFGNTAFIAEKPEVNCQTEKELVEASPYERTILLCMVNGGMKYMPDKLAYERNTFEAQSAMLQPGAAEKFVEVVSEKLRTMQKIKSMIAITEAFPDGQRITGAAIKYDGIVRKEDVSKDTYRVENRTIVRVYTNTEPRPAENAKDGNYVIIQLSAEDEDCETLARPKGPGDSKPKGAERPGKPGGSGGPAGEPDGPKPGGPGKKFSLNSRRKEIAVTVSQMKEVVTLDGEVYAPFSNVQTDGAYQEMVDQFRQFYHDGMYYSLYIPEAYDSKKVYPLVMFIPDATGGGDHPSICLEQGNGAINFARERDQKKHPAFVLGIQYGLEGPLTQDDFTVNEEGIRQIHSVLTHVIDTYSIDKNRIYTTGQSMGCMTSCELNIRYPDLFAASLLVAGQWDPVKMGRLYQKNFWILVSEHDAKAFPGMNAVTAAMEEHGATVGRYYWNAKAGTGALEAAVDQAAEEPYHIRYTVFEGDSVVPDGVDANPGTNHMSTWPVVYGIDALRDWLFTQKKEG